MYVRVAWQITQNCLSLMTFLHNDAVIASAMVHVYCLRQMVSFQHLLYGPWIYLIKQGRAMLIYYSKSFIILFKLN